LGKPGEKREHPIEVSGDSSAVGARIGSHEQILSNGHQREDAARFRHGADPRPYHSVSRPAVNSRSIEGDRSRSRRKQANDDLHRRRFAAGVAAEQRDDAPLANFKREVEMRLHRAIKSVDAIEDEERVAHDDAASVDLEARPISLWPR
jgi:hypothetical protein